MTGQTERQTHGDTKVSAQTLFTNVFRRSAFCVAEVGHVRDVVVRRGWANPLYKNENLLYLALLPNGTIVYTGSYKLQTSYDRLGKARLVYLQHGQRRTFST